MEPLFFTKKEIKMKKFLCLLLTLIMIISLAACGTAVEPASSLDEPAISEDIMLLPSTEDSNPIEVEGEITEPTAIELTDTTFKIGDTWTVDGQWSLTIDSVEETLDRKQYSDKNPGAVYLVTYTYTNLGYEDEYSDGLYISLEDTIIDVNGVLGSEYPGDKTGYPQETPVGATCKNAQACIGVETPGDFQIRLSKYDSTDTKQIATFLIEV